MSTTSNRSNLHRFGFTLSLAGVVTAIVLIILGHRGLATWLVLAASTANTISFWALQRSGAARHQHDSAQG
jgi:hypothetical protein